MTELETKSRSPLRWIAYILPSLAGPLAIVVASVYYLHLRDTLSAAELVQSRGDWARTLEAIAPSILTAVLAGYWIKCIWTRNPTYMVFTVMTGCLLLRELHWQPDFKGDVSIKDAIYPLLAICLVWAILWRDVLDKPSANRWQTVFLTAAIITYALGQGVEKRVLGKRMGLFPDPSQLHTQMEETLEVTAHLLLLGSAWLGSWKRFHMTCTPIERGEST